MASSLFATAQRDFVRDAALSHDEENDFRSTTLQGLREEIARIQEKQMKRRSMRYMQRLEPFLNSMEKYGKVVEIFLNTSDVVAFVWGPMKFILITASTHLDALNSVLDAYQTIGEQIPLLADFELLPSNDHMKEVLGMMYADILDFHREAMKIFRNRSWKLIFSATWRGLTSKIKHLTENMRRHRHLIENRATIMLFQEMIEMRRKSEDDFKFTLGAETDRRRDVIRQWLSAFNVEGEQELHQDHRSICSDSGKWLLGEPVFQDWFNFSFCSTPMLWMTGIPGAGKTVLASFVIDELENSFIKPDVVVAYFYCKFGIAARNTFVSVARSILNQLLVHTPDLVSHMYEQASINDKGGLATRGAAQALLQLALDTRRKQGTTYLVIDGLDECSRTERQHIASWFQEYIDSLPVDDKGLVRCLFVSQDDGVSRKDFSGIPCFKLTPTNMSSDLRAFVSVWHPRLEEKFGKLRSPNTHITNLITARAQGMFLFAKLMVEHLEGLPSREDLDREIHPSVFPDGLDQAYDRVMHRMVDLKSEALQRQLRKVLGWVACAPRPLRWREVQACISIDLDTMGDEVALNPKKRLAEHPRNLFSAFIEMRTNGVVELIHRTARDYLFRCKFVEPVGVHCSMAITCMGYLMGSQLQKEWTNDQTCADILAGTYSFLDYASACWAVHLQEANPPKTKSGMDVTPPEELWETLKTFVEMHWSGSCEPLVVTKALKGELARLCQKEASDEIVQAVAWSRKQLSLSSEAPSSKEALDLWIIVARVRTALESLQASGQSATVAGSLRELYGDDWFKCPRVSCLYYHDGFRTAKLRDAHVNKHDRPFLCLELEEDCKYKTFGFATEIELKKHMFELHGIDMLPDTEFPDLVVEDHNETGLEPDSSGRLKCPHCEKSFTVAHNLRGHVRTKHDGEKPYKCGVCEKSFAWSADRARHEVKHEGRKFLCFGLLDDGTEWGCKTEFSRQDKRVSHFRKAGRKCIEPLVKERLRLLGARRWIHDDLRSQGEVMVPRFEVYVRLCGLALDRVEASVEH